ncbi:haloacid dehalogenase [soil metagenome]
MTNWEAIVEDLRTRAQAMHEAREGALVETRKLIQLSSKSIRAVHRHEFADAVRLLEQAQETCRRARALVAPFPEMNPAYLHDSEKEMVEAAAVLAIVQDQPFPTSDELGVHVMSYLNGMGEAASEVRRFALDQMRAGHLADAERILAKMEAIYEELITFDFPDSLTGGLRRTCDALRAVIERTRSDLTATVSQQALVKALEATREQLSGR